MLQYLKNLHTYLTLSEPDGKYDGLIIASLVSKSLSKISHKQFNT